MARIEIPDDRMWRAGKRVARVLGEAGFEALFAGGMVRDHILGREAKDVDIATSATPEDVERLFPHVVTVGAQFGVAKVIDAGGDGGEARGHGEGEGGGRPVEVEVATFRVDGPHSDGRRPDYVTWASDREDALRRDFTINGLFLDPKSGELVDYVGGLHDMDRRLIRAIGDPALRFDEDKLRMMRAARFAAQLGFEIDPGTRREIERMAPQVTVVSAERIRDELVKLLMSPDPAGGVRLLKELGLLREILPEVERMDGVEQPPEFHPEGDVFTHTLLLLENAKEQSLPVRLGALFHDIGKPVTFERADRIRFNGHDHVGARMTDDVMRRLRFSNEERERVVALVADHMKFPALPAMRQSTLKRFLAQPHIDDHIALHRLDCLGSHGKLQLYDFAREKLAELGAAVDPEPLLRGRDLIERGYAPGKRMGEILARVREAQLEGEVATAEQALELVGREFPRP